MTPIRKILAVAGLLAVIAGGAFVFRNMGALDRSKVGAGTSDVPATPIPGTTSSPRVLEGDRRPAPPRPGAPTVAGIVEQSTTFAQAIASAKAAFGPEDPRVLDLIARMDVVCGGNLDPAGVTDPRTFDESRGWAIERIVALCSDRRHAPAPKPLAPGIDLAATERSAGKERALADAEAALRNAKDQSTVLQAAQYLAESDAIPELDGLGSDYGMADIYPALAKAVQLTDCQARGGCGPNSLETVTLCAALGCRPGVDFESALWATASPREARAIRALAGWYRRHRSPG